MSMRILIAEHETVYRAGLRALLEEEQGFRFVGESRNFGGGLRRALLLVACCAVMAVGHSVAAQTVSDETGKVSGGRDWIRGSFRFDVDATTADVDSDIELNQVLRLRMTPPKHKKISVHLGLWTIERLDSRESKTSGLRDLNDAFDSDVQARLLELYVQLDDSWRESTLRIGRQRIYESPAFNRMDGAYFKQQRGDWAWYLFGGVRASLYEDAHESEVAGGGMSLRLPTKGKVALDAYYGNDARRSFGRASEDIESTVVSLSFHQPLATNHTLYVRLRTYNEQLDKITVSAIGLFRFAERDITYSLTNHQQLKVVNDRARDLGGFFQVLAEQNQFQDILGTLDIPLSKSITLTLDGQFHDAFDVPLSTNRDFLRYGATLGWDEIRPGLDVLLSVERWDVSSQESSYILTGEVSKEYGPATLVVGVDYEEFQDRIQLFDLAALGTVVIESREQIYEVYAKVRYDINENQTLRLWLSYDQDDGPDSPYWELRGSWSIRF